MIIKKIITVFSLTLSLNSSLPLVVPQLSSSLMSQTRRFGTLWNLFLSHISNPKLTHGRKTGGGSKQIRATARQIHGGSIKTDPTVATVADHGEFGLILSWVFWWFGLIFCWFWVNFVVDYERLKWVALVVIGCFSSSSFILLLLDYCVRWDAVFVLWICVSFAGLVNGERERIWMLREKKKTKYCYTQLQEPRIFTRLL